MGSAMDIKPGDKVKYRTIEGSTQTTTGIVQDIFEEDTQFKRQTIHASKEHPRIVIKNDHTQKETAYKTNVIEKKIE